MCISTSLIYDWEKLVYIYSKNNIVICGKDKQKVDSKKCHFNLLRDIKYIIVYLKYSYRELI